MPTDYALYLRKSRADLEAEAHGEGDTLARHEHILMELAKSRALPIGAIYREIVSGERIANRPVMQQLLSEVVAFFASRSFACMALYAISRSERGMR